MIVRRMRERANQRPQLAPLRQHRQMLANLDARRPRRDRFELAPDIVRRIRLQIEAIVLSQTARQEDIDARLRLTAWPHGFRSSTRLAQPRHMVHPQSEQANRSRLEHCPTAKARMQKLWC